MNRLFKASRAVLPALAPLARSIASQTMTKTGIRKTTALRQMIKSPELEFLMEAHNGLSAKIVEEAGFKGIWGSGLSISAATGVRDSNEMSWTQVVDVMDFMCESSTLPILLDGDTGYGNFNNARRLVSKLETIGVAGVCIEDKLFPKTNSLLDGPGIRQPLASVDEFQLKIKAMKESQSDKDFVVVARVEAFIAGWGLEETLKRAKAYANAGADAVLIHSKVKNDPKEIKSFMENWDSKKYAPVVIVPTTYYQTPTDEFRKWGVSTVIWANHNMRASIAAMQQTCKEIYTSQNLVSAEARVAPVKEVFRLQKQAELTKAEGKYLPKA